MKRTNLYIILALAATTALMAGCSNHDGNEWNRLVCEVESVNNGAPLMSAYLYVGADSEVGTDDDIYPVDTVNVQFYARPYSSTMVLPEDGISSWFHVTNYDIIWHPGPSAPAAMTDYNVTNAFCDARVPVNDHGMVNILLIDRVMKEEAWYRDLINIAGHSFTAACELRFHGHETGNSEVVTINGGLMVTFFGAMDPD